LVSKPLKPKALVQPPIDVSLAGWLLFIACLWEILFNRLASALGVYSNVGATGFRFWVAESGRFAMNFVGIMALVLACAGLPRLAANHRFAPLSIRVVLMLASPFYLPVICVAVFRPVLPQLIFVGYIVSVASAVVISIIVASKNISSSYKRIVLGMGIIQILGAFQLFTRFAALFHSTEILTTLPHKSYLLGEVLFVSTAVFAFFVFRQGSLVEFIKRPHILGLTFACIATSIAVYIVVALSDDGFLRLVIYRTTGVTVAIPGGIPIYIVAFFMGMLLIGSLVLPSRRWPPTIQSKRIGFGLMFFWNAGVQPTHPYQFALMLLGFVLMARGLLGDELDNPATAHVTSHLGGDAKCPQQTVLDTNHG